MRAAALAAVLAVVLAGGCRLGDERPESMPPPRNPDTSDRGRIGDAITVKGEETELEVTVLRLLDPAPYRPPDRPLGAGARFVGLELRLRNIGEAPYVESPLGDAELLTTRGRADPVGLLFGPCAKRFASHLRLHPGERRDGCIVFEVAAGAEPTELRFALDSGFAPEVGSWRLVPR